MSSEQNSAFKLRYTQGFLIHQDLLFAQTPYFSSRESKRKRQESLILERDQDLKILISCVLKNPRTEIRGVLGFLTLKYLDSHKIKIHVIIEDISQNMYYVCVTVTL